VRSNQFLQFRRRTPVYQQPAGASSQKDTPASISCSSTKSTSIQDLSGDGLVMDDG
jgi:hypothetical protein